MTIKNVGFIGLGLMGSNMARRLLKKNYKVFSIRRGQAENINNEFSNFSIENNLTDVCKKSDLLLICVDTVENQENIFFGVNGVVKSEYIPEKVFDFSTSKPSFVKKIADALSERKTKYVDIPLGRTPAHALEGKLNLFLSCQETEVEKEIELLNILAENLFFLKNLGSGTKLKLLNNYYGQLITLIYGQMLLSCERVNLQKNDLVDVMSQGPLGSPMLKAILTHFNYEKKGEIEFFIQNALKDLQYYKDEISKPNDEFADLLISKFVNAVDNQKGFESVGDIAKYVE